MSTTKLSLDPERRSSQTMEFQASLRAKIWGKRKVCRRWWTCTRCSAPD